MSPPVPSKEERLRKKGMEVAIVVVLAEEGRGVVSLIYIYLPATPREERWREIGIIAILAEGG